MDTEDESRKRVQHIVYRCESYKGEDYPHLSVGFYFDAKTEEKVARMQDFTRAFIKKIQIPIFGIGVSNPELLDVKIPTKKEIEQTLIDFKNEKMVLQQAI